MNPPASSFPASRPLAIWLFVVAGFVGVTLLTGGVTRLAGAGLSITEWEPLRGVLPPLSFAAWTEQFARYRLTEQFRLINPDMTLEGFQWIFWWEWGHRLAARLSGVAFLLPFLWFWRQGRLAREELPWLALIFVLGAAQAVLGWWMVQSGLAGRVTVTPWRLASHLLAGLVLFTACVYGGLRYWGVRRWGQGHNYGRVVLVFLLMQSAFGALTAGLYSGYAYGDWPKMGGDWIPPALWYSPWIANPVFVQFFHRLLAYGLLLLTAWTAWRVRSPVAIGLFVAMLAQAALGVALLWMQVPAPLALLHQVMALVLLSLAARLVLDKPLRDA